MRGEEEFLYRSTTMGAVLNMDLPEELASGHVGPRAQRSLDFQ